MEKCCASMNRVCDGFCGDKLKIPSKALETRVITCYDNTFCSMLSYTICQNTVYMYRTQSTHEGYSEEQSDMELFTERGYGVFLSPPLSFSFPPLNCGAVSEITPAMAIGRERGEKERKKRKAVCLFFLPSIYNNRGGGGRG